MRSSAPPSPAISPAWRPTTCVSVSWSASRPCKIPTVTPPYLPQTALSDQARSIRQRAMFAKRPTACSLKMKAGPNATAVGRVTRIACGHQLDLRNRVEPGGPMPN
nr:phage virion morphogenesis protein [Halomonas salipaludis]